MTEFWKSQEKKYCTFCKCWIVDNKPSVQLHDNGKRHKDNVASKISELTKRSTKAEKDNKKMEIDMKKMEEAALQAYMKDMESNPDFTSLEYKKLQEEKTVANEEEVKHIVKKVTEEAKQMVKKVTAVAKVVPLKKLWNEAKTADNNTYYWNIETNESVWIQPEEGFVSLEEQRQTAEAATKLQEIAEKEKNEELRAWTAREQMKKFRKPEPPKEIDEFPGPILGPAPKADAYGSWTTVERRVEKQVDWQLPKVPRVVPDISLPEVREPRTKIKEKQIQSLEEEGEILLPIFKKRKPNTNRGNIRQRLDDD